MEAMLAFDLPEEEAEFRAAIDGLDHITAIRDFYERLRAIHKHGHVYDTAEEAFEHLFKYYCELMQAYL